MSLFTSHTMMLVIVTCIVSMFAFKRARLLERLIFWSPAIKRWQFSRFLTHGFIHADFQHLLFNMITLFFFGNAVEQFYRQYLGGFGFIVFYLTAIIVAIFPSYLQQRNNIMYRSLGASGAVSAVLFSFILFQPWATIYVLFLPLPAIVYAIIYTAYSIYLAKQSKDNINHSAHLTGAAFGIIASILLAPHMLAQFAQQMMHPLLGR